MAKCHPYDARRLTPGAVRRVADWIGRRPDVVAGISASVVYLLLPAALGLDYGLLAQKGPYQMMWLNLLGANYRLQIETPKPLMVLLAGLLGSGAVFYAMTCAMVGLSVTALIRLGRVVTGSNWPGLITAVAVFALRGGLMGWVFAGGTEPFHLALVLSSLVALAGGRLRLAALVVFATCLLRPEAWSLAPIPILWAIIAKRRFSPLLLLPFAAPFVWAVCDRAIGRDWLYSLHLTSYYRTASGISVAAGGDFWGSILTEMVDVAGAVPVLVGLAGLGVLVWGHVRHRGTARASDCDRSLRPAWLPVMAVGLALALPLVASWIISFFGHVLQMGRFHYPSAVLLTFLSVSAPFLLIRGPGPRKSRLALAASAAVALSTFVPRGIVQTVSVARRDEVRANAYAPIADTLNHLVENGRVDVTIVSARRLDYFAKLLGQSYSWRLRSIRELVCRTQTIPATAESGLLVYYDGDEVTEPSADDVIRRVVRAWPTEAVVDTVALLPDGRGGVWSIRSAPWRPGDRSPRCASTVSRRKRGRCSLGFP